VAAYSVSNARRGGSPRENAIDTAMGHVGRHGKSAVVDLYWLPLGAGGQFVRRNGRVFEAVASWVACRPACDLYHSALEVRLAGARFVIEQAPVRDAYGEQRGVVAEGPVGSRWAGRARIFRYEIRRWRDGEIPDIHEAVESPLRVSEDPVRARRLLDLVPLVPTHVWGRDELGAGEMWNSNSVIAWLIARSGIAVEPIRPPTMGRAPGWLAGLAAARTPDAETPPDVAAPAAWVDADSNRRSAACARPKHFRRI
jgi:hypothetical protein